MKISFIATVYNEEESINDFLNSILNQELFPSEIIITDGGSTDATISKISKHSINKKLRVKVLVKKGNRSIGRNEAIENSRFDIIACSDAGNILDKNWLKNISIPFADKTIDVVAGYYKGSAKNAFQKCLIPYVLVMPDKINQDSFLPATRSLAFKKDVWKKVGGFNEKYSHNEDYVFARKLKEKKFNIFFAKNAIVYWMPRNDIKTTFIMFARFAYGDIEAGIIRPKVILIFLRYLIVLGIVGYAISFPSEILTIIILILAFSYFLWAILKNYKYVHNLAAIVFLPLIQIISDLAVMFGSVLAIISEFV